VAHPFLEALAQGTVAHGGYQDGRVVDLRGVEAEKTVILVGDIHAKESRIHEIFRHAGLHSLLEQQRAVVVFLGDLFHREEDDRAGEMDSSLLTLQTLMDLKCRYPRGLYALLGNHEFTRIQSTKRGYFQGELFRRRLEDEGLGELYSEFIRASPLVVIHPQCVGVHAGPVRSVASLDELKALKVEDVHPQDMPRAVVEVMSHRHVSWSPSEAKAYNDYDVEDFLQLCGVPQRHLITGHTPLDRETGWNWDMGRKTTVIFAAGRECGYLKLTSEQLALIRVGRSALENDDLLIWDQAPPEVPGYTWEWERGRRFVRLLPPYEIELLPDVAYRFGYTYAPVELILPEGERLSLRQYRHLSPSAQAYYAQGYYLVGQEHRQEILKLPRDTSILLGGSGLREGVRFFWDERETALLRQGEPGEFELFALRPGLRLVAPD